MKPIPIVGQTLYSLNVNNAARDKEQKLTPVTVTKVGRKYFACRPIDSTWRETQYSIETWREKTKYSPDSQLYVSPQELEDEKEAANISKEIQKAFEYGYNRRDVSLDALRQIKAIIGPK